jgi:hypothetical protein
MRKLVLILVLLVAVAAGITVVAEKFAVSSPATEPNRVERVRASGSQTGREIRERMDKRREEMDREFDRLRAESEARAKAHAEATKNERPKRRKVRRFRWGAPPDSRGISWNIPDNESDQATLTAFLRICIAEADGAPQDCVGIWQVLRNIRRRSCSRDSVRRITECDENGETMLSVMRRAQPHILAVKGYALRNQRALWIRNLETDCEIPEGWRHGENRWDSQYGAKRCPHTVQLGRVLIDGEDLSKASRPGHRLSWLKGRPITWGGRCESGKAACDDRIACSRGLARLHTDTLNAFWRRPRSAEEVDPICKALGYGHLYVHNG